MVERTDRVRDFIMSSQWQWRSSQYQGRTGDSELERGKNRCRSAKEPLAPAAVSHATCVAAPVSIKLVTTFMLPCVAFEYGHSICAPSTIFWATSRSIPGRLTLRRA